MGHTFYNHAAETHFKTVLKVFRFTQEVADAFMIYSYITLLGIAFQVYSRLPPKKAKAGWILYFKKAATGVISHWISCLPARLPPSTKRTLSLASLPDSCSCCVLAVPRIQSVSRKKSHIILFISPGWKSLILGAFLKSCFFLRDKSEPSSLKAEFSELQRKLPQFDSVSPLPSLAVVSSVASSPACLLHFLSLLSHV